MAKVTFMDAILSGKRGGSVFSRNKAGYYVRQWVKPINPRTIAMQQARLNFGGRSNRYHSLTNLQKANWNAFAPFYNPKGVSVPSGISGFNAFIALGNLALSAGDNEWTTVVKKNGSGTDLPRTTNNFVQADDAPTSQLITTINVDGGFIPLVINPDDVNINIDETGAGGFQFSIPAVSGPIAGTGVTNPLQDKNGQPYGFGFYISNGVQQSHNFKANPEIQRIGSIANFELTTAPTAISTLELSGIVAVDTSTFQSFPKNGTIVQLTMYQIGVNGMCNKLMVKDIPIG